MRRDYGIAILLASLLGACATHERTYTSGGDTHLELRKVFGRTDGIQAAFTTTDAIYMFAPKEAQAEIDAVLAALDASKAEETFELFDVYVGHGASVTAYAREQVLEIGYPDGTLQIGWRAGRQVYVRFTKGKLVSWAKFFPSQKTDAAWRSLGSALRREAKITPLKMRGFSPLSLMRETYIDYQGTRG
jgi:hypothetical protein